MTINELRDKITEEYGMRILLDYDFERAPDPDGILASYLRRWEKGETFVEKTLAKGIAERQSDSNKEVNAFVAVVYKKLQDAIYTRWLEGMDRDALVTTLNTLTSFGSYDAGDLVYVTKAGKSYLLADIASNWSDLHEKQPRLTHGAEWV